MIAYVALNTGEGGSFFILGDAVEPITDVRNSEADLQTEIPKQGVNCVRGNRDHDPVTQKDEGHDEMPECDGFGENDAARSGQQGH